ncbi:MAG: type II toxin-antitoxin system prevent-host-death family antitoxin [Desulfobulbaceae bacterium]|nr:type II toxin-antitoxin system prevent-host-death family antitoxin [Desulfobulbaceae bacterium]
MIEVNIKEARSQLSSLLTRVNQGEEVAVTRHGKKIACLVPPQGVERLPSLADFRSSLPFQTIPLSAAVIDTRKQERY